MNEVFEMVAEVLEELRSEAGEREYSVCTKEAKNAAKEDVYKRQDDDRELCALIKRSVHTENIAADFCNTGKEGLQKLKAVSYTHLDVYKRQCHDLTKKIPDDLSAHLYLLGFSLEAYKNTIETIKEIEAVSTCLLYTSRCV